METRSNPTGRLLDIMVAAKAFPDQTVTRQVWASVFSCPANDTGALLEALANLIKLLVEAKDATERFVPGDQTIYMAPFPKIETILSRLHLDGRWQPLKAHLDERTISGLEFGSHILTPHYSEVSLNRALIESFIEQLNTLAQECLNSDFPENLKKFFIRNL